MSYLSWDFVALVGILLALFWVVPSFCTLSEESTCRMNLQGLILLSGCMLFYFSHGLEHCIFLISIALISFYVAKSFEYSAWCGKLLIPAVAIICTSWFVIKMFPWLLWEASAGKISFSLMAPLGISYFSLQAISYMVDVYRKKIVAEKSFGNYLLFLSYFPAAVQGPISRYNQLMPQLLAPKQFDESNFRQGILLVLFGLVKKMVVADRLGILVNYCFSGYAQLQGLVLYFGAVGYALQIYTDFSGCVDICRGVSNLFGISLIPNFNRPYLAISIKDFWSRWHISLSRWLRDYVYIPLGGNRRGIGRKHINLLATFVVSGIWHGVGIHYIVWGILNAVYQIIGEYTVKLRTYLKEKWNILPGSTSEQIFQRLITFHLIVLAWIMFRSETVTDALGYLFQMFSDLGLNTLMDANGTIGGLYGSEIIFLLMHVAVLFFIEMSSLDQNLVLEKVSSLHITLRWSLYIILIVDVLLFGIYGSGYSLSGFMYGGF